MMPISEEFVCTKIVAIYELEDGQTEQYETRVIERERALQKYEDSVASGETAVLATLPPIESQMRKNIMRLALANIPPLASVTISAFCSQKLEIEDESYCYRLPMAFVPAYLGNVSKSKIGRMDSSEYYASESYDSIESERSQSIQEVLDFQDIPVKTRSSGLWDLQVTVQGEGKLERVASINHPVKVRTNKSKTTAVVSLKPSVDRSLVPCKDFVLYVRD